MNTTINQDGSLTVSKSVSKGVSQITIPSGWERFGNSYSFVTEEGWEYNLYQTELNVNSVIEGLKFSQSLYITAEEREEIRQLALSQNKHFSYTIHRQWDKFCQAYSLYMQIPQEEAVQLLLSTLSRKEILDCIQNCWYRIEGEGYAFRQGRMLCYKDIPIVSWEDSGIRKVLAEAIGEKWVEPTDTWIAAPIDSESLNPWDEAGEALSEYCRG